MFTQDSSTASGTIKTWIFYKFPQTVRFLECEAITDILISQKQVENVPVCITGVHPSNQ